MDYPCNCKEMVWMMNNNKVFSKQDDRWLLTWKELDKDKTMINVEQFGVTVYYCMFCGNRINNS